MLVFVGHSKETVTDCAHCVPEGFPSTLTCRPASLCGSTDTERSVVPPVEAAEFQLATEFLLYTLAVVLVRTMVRAKSGEIPLRSSNLWYVVQYDV